MRPSHPQGPTAGFPSAVSRLAALGVVLALAACSSEPVIEGRRHCGGHPRGDAPRGGR